MSSQVAEMVYRFGGEPYQDELIGQLPLASANDETRWPELGHIGFDMVNSQAASSNRVEG
jgi:hypothetical protein